MAKKIVWLPRIAEMHRAAVNTSSSHFSRADLEKLFQVQTSAAGKLMALMPRSDALGSSHLVERRAVVDFLEGAKAAKDVPAYLERLRRDGPKVNRRRKIQGLRREDGLIVPKAPQRPDAVTFERGLTLIRYETPEEWMEAMLWALVRFGSDEEGFVRDYCVAKPEKADEDLDEVLQLLRKTEADFQAWIERNRLRRLELAGSSDGMSKPPSMSPGAAVCSPQ